MNKVIIHISDLHVSLHKSLSGTVKLDTNSWLTTSDDATSIGFIDHFIDTIKTSYTKHDKYLVISGDIANESDEVEYQFAKKYLDRILEKLNIKPSNLLIIPGDHDINRVSLQNKLLAERYNANKKEAYEYHEEKYLTFSKFYNDIKQVSFPTNKTVVDTLEINENILLIGLNSNFRIGVESGLGFISIDDFEKEIEVLNMQYPSHHKICVFHHNIISNFENKQTGQWDIDNRRLLTPFLERFEIKIILNGNEHTRGSEIMKSSSISISDCGAFSSKRTQASFKCYEIISDTNQTKLLNNTFAIQQRNGINDQLFGCFSILEPFAIKEFKEFVLFEKGTNTSDEISLMGDIPSSPNIVSSVVDIPSEKETNSIFYNNPEYSNKLYKIIKEKKLFHTGHFHWSETSRAHNWIDISKILEDNQDLLFVKNAILDVIETFNLENQFDFIIGLGTEGNIISTRTAIKYNKPYSPLPYSYRYDEHNSFERQLNFKNNNEFKTILVITDVVNDGRTIRKLIAKREKEFFINVDKIIVISLIYTGNSDQINTNILNSNNIKEFDPTTDEIVNKIEFYSVLNLKVEKCPYKDDFRDTCLIYKDKLSCVHLFYDEEKAIEKKQKSN